MKGTVAVSLQPKHLWEEGQAQKKNDLFSGQTYEITDGQHCESPLAPLFLLGKIPRGRNVVRQQLFLTELELFEDRCHSWESQK